MFRAWSAFAPGRSAIRWCRNRVSQSSWLAIDCLGDEDLGTQFYAYSFPVRDSVKVLHYLGRWGGKLNLPAIPENDAQIDGLDAAPNDWAPFVSRTANNRLLPFWVAPATAFNHESFDPFYYATRNPDIYAGCGFGVDCLRQHWNTYGKNECRRGSLYFDPKVYLWLNTDLEGIGFTCADAVSHYEQWGRLEGRNSTICGSSVHGNTPIYNADAYRAYNADLAALNDDQLCDHWQTFGVNEGRRASASFSIARYKALNPDLANLSNYYVALHYLRYGRFEGRPAL